MRQREPRIRIGLTMRRDQHEALREQATFEKHDNLSFIVQRAIDRELKRAERERQAETVPGVGRVV